MSEPKGQLEAVAAAPLQATPQMERAAEEYWNDRRFKGLSDDPRTWAGLYAAMVAAGPVQPSPQMRSSEGHHFSPRLPRGCPVTEYRKGHTGASSDIAGFASRIEGNAPDRSEIICYGETWGEAEALRDKVLGSLSTTQPVADDRGAISASVGTSIVCWSCKLPVSLDDRADADGSCPHCSAELDLEECLRAALARPEQAEQQPVAWQARFIEEGNVGWEACPLEHHEMVKANPREWPGYETRELYAAPIAQAAPQPEHSWLVEMVDRAMVEMRNIHPPMRRSDCERLIRAALFAQGGDQ